MEELFKNKYKIKSTRLSGYDYSSSGFYFVTICTYNRLCHFGDVAMDDNHEYSVALTDIGKIARDCWLDIPKHFPFVVLDQWVIMPNHVHGIIVINKPTSNGLVVETQNFASHYARGETMTNALNETQNFASLRMRQTQTTSNWTPNRFGPQSRNLASVIRGFKIGVTKYANNHNLNFHWQPRYYDRIIRDERALYAIRRYIKINPQKWERDRNNIENIWY